jgi:hypothetical protein
MFDGPGPHRRISALPQRVSPQEQMGLRAAVPGRHVEPAKRLALVLLDLGTRQQVETRHVLCGGDPSLSGLQEPSPGPFSAATTFETGRHQQPVTRLGKGVTLGRGGTDFVGDLIELLAGMRLHAKLHREPELAGLALSRSLGVRAQERDLTGSEIEHLAGKRRHDHRTARAPVGEHGRMHHGGTGDVSAPRLGRVIVVRVWCRPHLAAGAFVGFRIPCVNANRVETLAQSRFSELRFDLRRACALRVTQQRLDVRDDTSGGWSVPVDDRQFRPRITEDVVAGHPLAIHVHGGQCFLC